MRDYYELTEQIENYKQRKDYSGLMLLMDQYGREAVDPQERATLALAKANAALHLKDFGAAEEALSSIDLAALGGASRNYVDITKASAARMRDSLQESDRYLSAILARPETQEDEQRDVLREALAQKAFIYSDMKQYKIALQFLEMALSVKESDGLTLNLTESIANQMGYCLQAMGQLDRAEECLTQALSLPGNRGTDTYYRLGAVQLEKGEFIHAKASFQYVLDNLANGGVSHDDARWAMQEAEAQLARVRR